MMLSKRSRVISTGGKEVEVAVADCTCLCGVAAVSIVVRVLSACNANGRENNMRAKDVDERGEKVETGAEQKEAESQSQ